MINTKNRNQKTESIPLRSVPLTHLHVTKIQTQGPSSSSDDSESSSRGYTSSESNRAIRIPRALGPLRSMRLRTTSSGVARPRTPFFLPETATEIELEAEIGIETATEIEIEIEIEIELERGGTEWIDVDL